MSATTNQSLEEKLLSDIRDKYSAYIEPACKATVFPASLLAALTANETGLDDKKNRFEPSVFVDLAQVLAGRKANFGWIGAEDIKSFLDRLRPLVDGDITVPIAGLMHLATSWGPTQIMGYHILTVPSGRITGIQQIPTHFTWAVRILDQFRKEFHLSDDFTDATPYFRCWNTGRPDGRTFDPSYALNGMSRMRIYESLPPRANRGESETA